MTSKLRTALILAAAVLISSSLALASGAPSTPPAPAGAAAAPPLALSAAAPACPRADLPALLPGTAQPLANDICGGCSDAACFGHEINFACGVGFRCILQIACVPTAPSCRCLPID